MSSRIQALVVLVGLLLVVLVHPAWAQEKLSQNQLDPRFEDTPIITDPFDFSVGGFLVDLNTSAAFGGSSGLGSVIRLEETLGLDESQQLLRIGFRWDFARKHSLGLTWFSISRGSTGLFDEEVDFVDLRFVGYYNSTFDVDYYGLDYRYSLINNNRVNAGFSFGISTFDFSVGIDGDAYLIAEIPTQPIVKFHAASADIIAPVPAIGMFIEYAITKRLIVSSKVQYVDLTVSGYDGRFMDLEFTVDWFFTRHFGIGGGVASTDISVAYTGDDPYRVDYRYSGILFHLRGSF